MRVWERRGKVSEDTLDALVWTTALNLARNRLRWRRLRRHDPLDESSHGLSSPEASADFLAERQLHHALRKLPHPWQQVILLSHFSGLAGAQIAAVLGVPVGTVASRKHQAMARLKSLMGATFDA